MKQKTLLLPYLLLAAIVLSACAPVYKCGDPIPAKKSIFWGKNLKTVIIERDTLCARLSASELQVDSLSKDTTKYKSKIKDQKRLFTMLDDEYRQLNAEYDSLLMTKDKLGSDLSALSNEKKSESEKLNKALKLKSDELDAKSIELKAKSSELSEKERLLAEREKSLKELQAIIARQDSVSKRLNDILRKALLGFKADELSVELKNGKVYVSMSDKLLFKSGSSAVESKGVEALKVLAGVLVKNTDIEIAVEGHTDNVPMKGASAIKDNWDLSVIRATSIVRILTQEYAVSPINVTASGRGEFMPRASNETAEGRAKNRRTEIILSPKLDEVMELLNSK